MPAPAALFAFFECFAELAYFLFVTPQIHKAVFTDVSEFFYEFRAGSDFSIGVKDEFKKTSKATHAFCLSFAVKDKVRNFLIVRVVQKGVFFQKGSIIVSKFLFIFFAKLECIIVWDEKACGVSFVYGLDDDVVCVLLPVCNKFVE